MRAPPFKNDQKNYLSSFVCLVLLSFCALIPQGCGYHFGQGELSEKYTTLSIPYVIGDKYGDLTAALVKEFARSGAFEYRQTNGEISLLVSIISVTEENIGFRYDRDKKDERINSIIPTETRIKALVEVSVVESCSGCQVLGPSRISAYVDYDHDYYFGSNDVNSFSLGQLTDVDAAYDAVQKPLYLAVAKKVVDYVTQSW